MVRMGLIASRSCPPPRVCLVSRKPTTTKPTTTKAVTRRTTTTTKTEIATTGNTMLVLPAGAATNFYGKNAIVWNALTFTAIAYTGLSNLANVCLRPIPILNKALPTVTPLPFHVVSSKVAVITGSNTGIGFETSRALVERGFEVVMACRSRDKAMKAIEAIESQNPNAPGKAVFVAPLDLSSIDSINAFSTVMNDKYDKIDVLINNAGRNYGDSTKEGFDEVFFTNYLGHFLLTQNLMDNLLKADKPRVVNLSSVMHHFCGNTDTHSAEYWRGFALSGKKEQSSYSPSKLAALFFTIELNRRYRSKGLRSIAVNPGAVNSDIWRNKPRYLVPLFKLLYLTNTQGCHTSVAAAVSEDLPDNAFYLQPYHQVRPSVAPFPPLEMLGVFVGHLVTRPRLPNDGTDGQLSSQVLWETSEKLLEQTVGLKSN